MNREETKRAAEVMLHYANGGEVQVRNRENTKWLEYDGTREGNSTDEPWWDWHSLKYRIKPQPVIVERWIVSTKSGHSYVCRTLEDARSYADWLDNSGTRGITLEHLKGESQPWPN